MAWHPAWPRSLLLSSTLFIRLILREKKNDGGKTQIDELCGDTAIMQSLTERSRILKRRGSEFQSCASSKLDEQLIFIPQTCESSVIDMDRSSICLFDLIVFQFFGTRINLGESRRSDGDRTSLGSLFSVLTALTTWKRFCTYTVRAVWPQTGTLVWVTCCTLHQQATATLISEPSWNQSQRLSNHSTRPCSGVPTSLMDSCNLMSATESCCQRVFVSREDFSIGPQNSKKTHLRVKAMF